MKALMKVASGPGNLELRELPEPEPRPGEAVVRVVATGICGSDLHIQDDEYKVVPPVVIGHETAGMVVAVGEGVANVKPGDLVTSQTTISTCGTCELCLSGRTNLCPERRWLGGHVNGGFASLFRVPARNLLHLPAGVTCEAAALTEPLACCVHGVLEVGLPALGDRSRRNLTAVISGPGPIGLLCAQVARAAGARVIVLGTSADGARFALAQRLGLMETVDVQRRDPATAVAELTDGRGPDLVVEAAGAAASLDQCFTLAPRGGVIVQIGLYGKPAAAPIDALVLKELRLLGTFSSTPTAWPKALELIGNGQVQTEPLVTSTRPLDEWADAFQAARRKGEGKILLTPVG